MRSAAVFRDIERTYDLERYLFSQTEGLVSRLLGSAQSPHLVVKVYQDRHRQQSGASHYVCEILLTLKQHSAVIKVRKAGNDFYDCVADAGTALRGLIRRKHDHDQPRRSKP